MAVAIELKNPRTEFRCGSLHTLVCGVLHNIASIVASELTEFKRDPSGDGISALRATRTPKQRKRTQANRDNASRAAWTSGAYDARITGYGVNRRVVVPGTKQPRARVEGGQHYVATVTISVVEFTPPQPHGIS